MCVSTSGHVSVPDVHKRRNKKEKRSEKRKEIETETKQKLSHTDKQIGK